MKLKMILAKLDIKVLCIGSFEPYHLTFFTRVGNLQEVYLNSMTILPRN